MFLLCAAQALRRERDRLGAVFFEQPPCVVGDIDLFHEGTSVKGTDMPKIARIK
jgi:hypothetical protein